MTRAACLLACLLTACADVCQHADAVAASFATKVSACTKPSSMPFDLAACEASLKACSSKDEAVLRAWYDCLDALPACTPASQAAFDDAVLACANHMAPLSPGCFTP